MAYTSPGQYSITAGSRPMPVRPWIGDSYASATTVSGPAAGAFVARLIPTMNASYVIQVSAGYVGGSPASAEAANMSLRADGTSITLIPVPAQLGLSYFTCNLTLDGTQELSIITGNTASSGTVVYAAQLVATPFRPGGD